MKKQTEILYPETLKAFVRRRSGTVSRLAFLYGFICICDIGQIICHTCQTVLY